MYAFASLGEFKKRTLEDGEDLTHLAGLERVFSRCINSAW